jgi:hypothetical protein
VLSPRWTSVVSSRDGSVARKDLASHRPRATVARAALESNEVFALPLPEPPAELERLWTTSSRVATPAAAADWNGDGVIDESDETFRADAARAERDEAVAEWRADSLELQVRAAARRWVGAATTGRGVASASQGGGVTLAVATLARRTRFVGCGDEPPSVAS